MSNAERHLRRPGYGKCIIKDSDFQRVRDALQSKWKELKSQGKGNKPKATTALSDEDIDILYSGAIPIPPYPKIMVNLFSFGCHVIDRAYVRTYASTDCTGGVGETIKRKGGCLRRVLPSPHLLHWTFTIWY